MIVDLFGLTVACVGECAYAASFVHNAYTHYICICNNNTAFWYRFMKKPKAKGANPNIKRVTVTALRVVDDWNSLRLDPD